MKRKYFHYINFLLTIMLFVSACKEEEYKTPEAGTTFQNDCIKRSMGPNIVGLDMEFAYAIALPQESGKIVSAQVEASIAGASTTYLENKSYYTNSSGVDIGIPIGEPSVNQGATTTTTFTVDTMAATLRYFYTIPEEARGKTVSFTFSAKSSTGETVSYKMGPYTIASMDMALNLEVKNEAECYISIEDMAVYTATDAASKADKIDLVYLYRALPTVAFNHALVSPASDPQYLQGATLPVGANKNTKMRKEFNLQDRNLANLQNGIYIDDIDFQKLDLTDAPNYAINLKAESGAWIETADGKYRAYIFMNKINDAEKGATISIKRLKMN